MKKNSVFNFEQPFSSENMQLQTQFNLDEKKTLYVNQKKGPHKSI